ncbi:MAG TPA: hypothetical protein PKA95_01960 [Thermomicrobiales bacterium]|nr:hypothetical protein [Thermomicrobiales bacterium]
MSEVLGGQHLVTRRAQIHSQQAEKPERRGVEQPDDRAEDTDEGAKRQRDRHGRPFRLLQRDRLWDELANDDMQPGDEEERHRYREGVGQRRSERADDPFDRWLDD